MILVKHNTYSADGAARIGSTVFGELLNAVFANVGQHAIRKVARETFEHLLNLDLKFHLSRHTGGLTRAIDRGTKCVFCVLFPHTEVIPEHIRVIQRHHFHSSSYHLQDCTHCFRDLLSVRYLGMCIHENAVAYCC